MLGVACGPSADAGITPAQARARRESRDRIDEEPLIMFTTLRDPIAGSWRASRPYSVRPAYELNLQGGCCCLSMNGRVLRPS